MPTTITVDRTTHAKLAKLKEAEGAETFDELLAGIADRELAVPESLFGAASGLRDNFEREHEERV
ncbi:MAG: hypothetical protein ABEI97_02130 [Candidatus Nanohaloarchaea archaeon]